MENISTSPKTISAPTKVFNPIFLYIKDDVVIKFSKVFLFPGSEDSYVGHLKVWHDQASFYFVFKQSDLYSLNMKGYKDAKFVPNMFRNKIDKKGRTFYACSMNNANCEFNYRPINNADDYRKVIKLRNLNPNMYIGYDEKTKLGEAFMIINHE